MIQLEQVSKNFGKVRALDGISFDVREREVLGFLGPNGAGKTTALRILAGFLPADSGTVTVAGFNVETQSLQARRMLGYLPEGVPLHPEMRVGEYLRFRSRLKGVPRSARREQIARALDRARIETVEKRIVGTLSRGYRQRVGLADALLGDPQILILDEPTVGLDPEQIRQFRSLLGELGKEKTIIFSTHILTEVEQVAQRFIIIHNGRILAQDTAEKLRQRLGPMDRIRAEIAAPSGVRHSQKEIARALAGLPDVEDARFESLQGESKQTGYSVYTLRPRSQLDPRQAVFLLVKERGWHLRELARVPLSLEEIFLEIVGDAKP